VLQSDPSRGAACSTTRVRRKHYVRWREDGRQRIARFDTPEQAEDFEQRRGGGTNPVDVQSPEVAALAARLAQLEAQTSTGTRVPGCPNGEREPIARPATDGIIRGRSVAALLCGRREV
jgi:hypothetical protein